MTNYVTYEAYSRSMKLMQADYELMADVCRWLVSLGDPENLEARRSVTFRDIAARAEAALYPPREIGAQQTAEGAGDGYQELVAEFRSDLEGDLKLWESAQPHERPVEEIQHVLWHHGRGGFAPDSVERALLAAITGARGTRHRELLHRVYPDLVMACLIIEELPDGAERLQRLV